MRRLGVGAIPLSILFVFLWSSGLVGSKFGQDFAGTFTLLMWRYAVVTITLIVIVYALKTWKSISRSELISTLAVGVLSHAIFLGASLASMELGVSVGMAAFVLALQPMTTSVFAASLTGERASIRQWAGLVLGLIAVLMVVGDRLILGGSPFAYSLLFIATLAISIGTLIDRRLVINAKHEQRTPTPVIQSLLIHCIGALAVFVIMAGLFEGFQVTWNPSFVFSIAWLGWVVSLAAYGLMFVLLRQLSTIKVSCLIYLSPPATMLISYVVFGERLGAVDLIGLLVAAIAVWIVSTPEPRHATRSEHGSVNL